MPNQRFQSPPEPGTRICLGVSACLLGERVRFDGAHKHQSFITDVLARDFELVPVCPEVAIGLGIPRPPIRLQGDPADPRAVGADAGSDVTDALAAYGREMAGRLAGISGYIFKGKSPSCGLWRVKVYRSDGRVSRDGTGIYAREIARAFPLLPLEEEGGLADPRRRAGFLARVHAFKRWQGLLAAGLTEAALLAFHAEQWQRHPFDDRGMVAALERIGERPLAETARAYGEAYMRAVAARATGSEGAQARE